MRAGTAVVDVPEVNQQAVMTAGGSVVGEVKDHCSSQGDLDTTYCWRTAERIGSAFRMSHLRKEDGFFVILGGGVLKLPSPFYDAMSQFFSLGPYR